jgi:tetratricopeptide (TPR) repeat protein
MRICMSDSPCATSARTAVICWLRRCARPGGKAALCLWTLLALTQTAQREPSQEEAIWHHRNLAKAFYENATTPIEAVAEFKKALDLAPDSIREQLNYGLALLRADRGAEAVEVLLAVQKKAPGLPNTWFNLGIYYKKTGEIDKAIEQSERMTELVPEEPKSHFNLGVLYRQKGRPEDALREVGLAARLDPNLAAPHFVLFNILRAQGKREEATRIATPTRRSHRPWSRFPFMG